MYDDEIKSFVERKLNCFTEDLRIILTDYSSFKERMQIHQNERLDDLIESLNYVGDKLRNIEQILYKK